MASYRAKFRVRAAWSVIARLAMLSLIAVLPLAGFTAVESSIEASPVPGLATRPGPSVEFDFEALQEEPSVEEDSAARLVVSMIVTEGEEFEIPEPPAAPALNEPPSIAGLRFWTGGDSTATYMSIKLVERFTDLGAAATGSYYQHSTGLARPDYFDWLQQLRTVMQEFRPDIAVFMVGANDSQGIRDADGTPQSPFSDEWRALYAGRVGEVMDLLQAQDGYVVYVGQPNMGREGFGEKMAIINEIIRAEADKRPHVGYVDAWTLFSDESGAYQEVLPNDDGVPTLFRAGDGVHFTWAGGDRLALAVIDEVHRQIRERPIASLWQPPDDILGLLP